MTVRGNQQIFRLQVSIGDLVLVKVVECTNYFCHIEKGDVVGEQILSTQKTENLTTLHILERQVDMSHVFETFKSANIQVKG